MQSQLFRAVRYRRQCMGVVLGLVRHRLLSEVPGDESQRPGPRHVSHPSRRVMGRYREISDLRLPQLGPPHRAWPEYRVPLRQELQVEVREIRGGQQRFTVKGVTIAI